MDQWWGATPYIYMLICKPIHSLYMYMYIYTYMYMYVYIYVCVPIWLSPGSSWGIGNETSLRFKGPEMLELDFATTARLVLWSRGCCHIPTEPNMAQLRNMAQMIFHLCGVYCRGWCHTCWACAPATINR